MELINPLRYCLLVRIQLMLRNKLQKLYNFLNGYQKLGAV